MPRSDRPHIPGYGIAPGDEGLLPWSWALERLGSARDAWIAVIGREPDLTTTATRWTFGTDG